MCSLSVAELEKLQRRGVSGETPSLGQQILRHREEGGERGHERSAARS